VTIPAGNERCLETSHRLRFHDQILEDLVEGRPHVDIAVRKGRTVMKNILWRSLASLLDGLIKPFLLPFRQKFRLTLSKPGLHWEVGLGKANSVFVAGHKGKS
jgi:hypothetical protein